MPATHTLRASVTADATGVPGAPAPILVDGADTPITANGLMGYRPTPGDRLLVQQVGGVVEILQFVSTGTVPGDATFRQDTDPALSGFVPDGAIWFNTSAGNQPSRREGGAWVPMAFTADALDVENVKQQVVETGFTLGGGNVAALSSGATNPLTSPVVEVYYPSSPTPFYTNGGDRSFYMGDMVEALDNTSQWIMPGTWFNLSTGSPGTLLEGIRKSDGSLVRFPITSIMGSDQTWQNNFQAHGGIATCNGDYYICGLDIDRTSQWYIYRIDGATFAKISEINVGSGTAFGGASRYYPKIVSDGSHIGIVWINPSDNMILKWYAGDLSGTVGSNITLFTGITQRAIGGLHWGDAGAGGGANTLWVGIGTATTTVFAYTGVTTTSATRASSLDFTRPDNASISALAFDTLTNHFNLVDNGGTYRTTSQLAMSGSQSLTTRYTYYDGDTGNYAGTVGSGTVIIGGVDKSGLPSTTHETGYSPTTASTISRRAWVRVTVTKAPDVNNADPTLVDRANRHGVYISLGGGTMWRQAYTSVGQTVVDGFDVMPTSGTPAANDFSTAQASLGEFSSVGLRLDGTPLAYIDGSGKANLDGLIPAGTIVMSARPTPIAGWLTCDGSSQSRAAYPDLFAAIGTAYGSVDSTHFNLPDLRARHPVGFLSGDSVVGALGAYEGNTAGGVVAGAGDSGRLNHQHTHTIDIFSHTQQTNTASTGSANRLSGPVDHTHTENSRGVGTGNQAYHAWLVVNFQIKT